MAKFAPRERWVQHVQESIKALKLSGKLKPLRSRGLTALHRTRLYTNEEWLQSFSQRTKSLAYVKWYGECEALGDEFGLAPWVVAIMCLLKGYHPEKDVGFMAMERDWPRIRVVTDSTNPLFLRSLSREAQRLGLYIVHRLHGVETTLLNLDDYGPDVSVPGKFSKRDVFKINVETPVGYPPEAASELQKEASRLARELSTRMGCFIPKRLRPSKLVTMSEVLEAKKGPLPRGKIYAIVDKMYPDGDLSKDQQRRKLTASRRHRVRKRLFGKH